MSPALPAADAAAASATATQAAQTAAVDSDLVFFINPLSLDLPKGKTVQMAVVASGAKGLTSGTLQLSVDPKLSIKSITAGDFLTTDGGTL